MMFCPECQKLGLRSRVYPGVGTVTLLYCPPFYDEEGRMHHHDLNTTTQDFICSNGHSWSRDFRGSCWCGWPEKVE